MSIDARIPLMARGFEIPSPMNNLARMMALEHSDNQNQLAQLQMQEARAVAGEREGLRAAFGGNLDLDTPEGQAALYRAAPTQAGAILKNRFGMLKDQGEMRKTGAETAGIEAKQKREKIDYHLRALGGVNDEPGVVQWISSAVKNGVMSQEEALADVQQLQKDPQGLTAWKQRRMMGGVDLAKQLELNAPKIDWKDTGGSLTPLQTNPYAGAVGPASNISAVPITQSENNKATVGASYANAAATRDAAATQAQAARDAAKITADRNAEMKLSDDYRAQSKDFGDVKSAYKQVMSTIDSATTSPYSTLVAATKFMKIIDPGSVVRESELGMALAATGALDRAQNYLNTLKMGKVLTVSQTADLKATTAKIYEAAQKVQQDIDAHYKKVTTEYKLRPEMVIQDLGQGRGKAVNFGDLK